MKITSTRFIKGIIKDDEVMDDGIPQVAFIGRSNVGKSSLINALTKTDVSRTSSFPGRTQMINFFLINEDTYFVDLPGYGFARASGAKRDAIGNLIDSYLFNKVYKQKKVVLIIDVNVGMTDTDVSMFKELEQHGKDIIIALSKIDKMKASESHRKIKEINQVTGERPLFLFSSKKQTGIAELVDEILK